MNASLLLLKLCLEELGIPLRNTKESHRLTQYAVYLMKHAGFDLGYNFPYYNISEKLSSDWEDLIFKLPYEKDSDKELIPAVKERIKTIKPLFRKDKNYKPSLMERLKLTVEYHYAIRIQGKKHNDLKNEYTDLIRKQLKKVGLI